MGLIRKTASGGTVSPPSYSNSEDEKTIQAEHLEDVKHGHEEVDPALASRIVRKFDRMTYTA